jgi:hypothetical protein
MKRKPSARPSGAASAPKRQKSGHIPAARQTQLSLRVSKRLQDKAIKIDQTTLEKAVNAFVKDTRFNKDLAEQEQKVPITDNLVSTTLTGKQKPVKKGKPQARKLKTEKNDASTAVEEKLPTVAESPIPEAVNDAQPGVDDPLPAVDDQHPARKRNPRAKKSVLKKEDTPAAVDDEDSAFEEKPTKKRKARSKKSMPKKEEAPDAADDEDYTFEEQPKKKRKARAKKSQDAPPSVAIKKQKAKAYGIVWGVSPYPKVDRPTPEECKKMVDILSEYHGYQIPAKAVPPPSLTRAGCGNVPAVHDALLRTLLSSATQTSNANSALDNLIKVYGVAESGVGKGSINWEAVRAGSQDKLFKTIQCAGLAGGKSRDIKKILDEIVLENKERCEKLVASGETLSEEVSRPY